MLRKDQPNYIRFLKNFHPTELQTKCKALARYRYRRPLVRFGKHQVILDRLVMSVQDGKAIVHYKSIFGGYK